MTCESILLKFNFTKEKKYERLDYMYRLSEQKPLRLN